MESIPARRRRWPMIAGITVALLGVLAVILALVAHTINATLRSKLQTALSDRFGGDITFKQFDVSMFPRFSLNAGGMVVRRTADADLPPLLEAVRIQGEGPFLWLLMGHVRHMKIEGLSLNIPAGHKAPSDSAKKKARFPVVIDEIVSDGAHLEILRTKSEKPPLEFQIRHLDMRGVDLDNATRFQATLDNPEPRGEIETKGQFGPWDGEEPSQTPVSGSYKFSHADLATFNGIGGILESTGSYKGVLSRLEVDGQTTTPDFSLTMARHPLPLETEFHAIVDGTNGNTTLQSVQGKLANTPIFTSGEIAKFQDHRGRTILLTGEVQNGRLEDILKLVVQSSPPPLSGLISLRTKIDIPPGDEDVIRKLRLNGTFDIRSARFSSINIREKLRSLSRKAKGMPDDPSAGSAVTNMKGAFELNRGVASFSQLTFQVDGASIQLAGKYDLQGESMDFHGKLLMDAKLSQTTTGAKAFFLKALDPLFHKKDGGSEIPIRISGTRSDPSFSLDIGKKF